MNNSISNMALEAFLRERHKVISKCTRDVIVLWCKSGRPNEKMEVRRGKLAVVRSIAPEEER